MSAHRQLGDSVGAGYTTAIFGLLGALLGGLTSFATSFATQRAQLRETYRRGERAKRENLFRDFIAEATRLHLDALSHEKDDVTELIRVYGILANMKLINSRRVTMAADGVLQSIVDIYLAPNRTLHEIRAMAQSGEMDILTEFSEACREELAVLAHRG